MPSSPTACGCMIPKPDYNEKYAVFATRYGSVTLVLSRREEQAVILPGVAHFLEHKLFEGEEAACLGLRRPRRIGQCLYHLWADQLSVFHYRQLLSVPGDTGGFCANPTLPKDCCQGAGDYCPEIRCMRTTPMLKFTTISCRHCIISTR